MADLGCAGAAAGPVVARVVGAIRIGAAVGLRAGQHIVRVGGVACAVDYFALLVERRLLEQIATEPRELDRIAVELGEILGDRQLPGIVPGALPDPVAGIDGRLAGPGLSAQISVPNLVANSLVAASDGHGEPLAM